MLQRTKYQNIPVLAATVHKFQGSERDMMIFDTVDSYPQERPGVLFFDHKNHRLVNVAVTRARGSSFNYQIAIICVKTFREKQALSQLTAHIERHGDVYDRTTSRQLWERKISKRLRWFMEMNLEEAERAIKRYFSRKTKNYYFTSKYKTSG